MLAAAAAAGLVLILGARRRQEVRQRLIAYCADRGYRMEDVRQRLRRAAVIHGNGWRLSTGIQSSEPGTQSGSPDTAAYTRWEAGSQTEQNTALLWFGTAQGQAGRLTDAMLPLLSSLGVAGLDGMRVRPLHEALRNRFALLAADAPELAHAGDDLEPVLAGWPEDWPLRVSVGTAAIQISVPGKRMDQPRDLDRIIGLGERCVTYRDSIIQSDGYK